MSTEITCPNCGERGTDTGAGWGHVCSIGMCSTEPDPAEVRALFGPGASLAPRALSSTPLERQPVYDPEFCHCQHFHDAVVLQDGHDERCIWSARAKALGMDYDDND